MLPKENRIRKKKDFETVFKKGKTVRDKFLVLRFAENNLKDSRFGFVVSLKVSKKAVLRNKIRRRLSALASLHLSQIKRGRDIAFIAQPGIEKKEFKEIKDIFESIIKKGLL